MNELFLVFAGFVLVSFAVLGLSVGCQEVEDGLSQNTAYGTFQDRQGFVWIGTVGGGLNRYDGYSVEVYRALPGDTTALTADDPGRFLETQDGGLWIGTRRGLSRVDPVSFG